VILTFIFIVISLAADMFMLTFLNATVRELRPTRILVVETRPTPDVAIAKQEQRHHQDRAA
jgi:hypothetical protein